MSIEKRTIIWCDHSDCGQGYQKLVWRRGHRSTTAQEVREDGAKKGWTYRMGVVSTEIYKPPADFCPRHSDG